MGQPAAKQGDQVIGNDTHIVVTPAGPAPLPFPFTGKLTGGLSTDVQISGLAAAVAGSTADNLPPHLSPPGAPFQRPPSNSGTVQQGSQTVQINGKPAARAGDQVSTCNDPADLPVGTVLAFGTVLIG